MIPRLYELYNNSITKDLIKEFNYSNPMQCPKLEKIVLNMGVGEASQDRKKIEPAVEGLTLIAGQKAVITRSKKAIAGFKLRENMPVGCKVTLRGKRMYEFLDRLVTIALPRVKDFRGLRPKNFDGNGNYSFGLREQIVFPEIDYDKIDVIRGLDITFCTSAKTNEEAKALLAKFNVPFRTN